MKCTLLPHQEAGWKGSEEGKKHVTSMRKNSMSLKGIKPMTFHMQDKANRAEKAGIESAGGRGVGVAENGRRKGWSKEGDKKALKHQPTCTLHHH